jgi:excisionase family DNA binding protein
MRLAHMSPIAVVRRHLTRDDNMLQNTTETGRRAHSIEQACVLTGLGRDGIYAAIRDGHLVARKFGRRTLITDDDRRSGAN